MIFLLNLLSSCFLVFIGCFLENVVSSTKRFQRYVGMFQKQLLIKYFSIVELHSFTQLLVHRCSNPIMSNLRIHLRPDLCIHLFIPVSLCLFPKCLLLFIYLFFFFPSLYFPSFTPYFSFSVFLSALEHFTCFLSTTLHKMTGERL